MDLHHHILIKFKILENSTLGYNCTGYEIKLKSFLLVIKNLLGFINYLVFAFKSTF